MRSPTVLLTGHTGFLGHHLADELRRRGVAFVTGGRGDADVRLDLDDLEGLGRAVVGSRAEVVLHAAATSSMAACAADPDGATRRNGDAVEALARGCRRVVLVSTDLVFDGAEAPYGKDAVPRPRGPYGRSKRVGEERALAAGGLVVRIPLLFGRSFDGRRGATDMLRSACAGSRRLRLYVDEFRSPLHVRDAAAALVDLALDPGRAGVVHAAGPERVSRFELAERFARRHDLAVTWWDPAESDDPTRPRDVSMVSDVPATRSLDEMLADS